MIKFGGWFRRRKVNRYYFRRLKMWKCIDKGVWNDPFSFHFVGLTITNWTYLTFQFEDFALSNYMYMYSKHNDPIITTRFHCKRNFAKANFRSDEISPRWLRNFVWLNENSRALWRNFMAKSRENKKRKTPNFFCISFAQYCSLSIYSHQVGLAFSVLCFAYVFVAV